MPEVTLDLCGIAKGYALDRMAQVVEARGIGSFVLEAGGDVLARGRQAIMILFIAVPLGSALAIFVELFPSEDRLTAYSISFNLGIGVIGGMTPMVAIWLIATTGAVTAPARLLTGAGISAALALMWMKDRSREVLL